MTESDPLTHWGWTRLMLSLLVTATLLACSSAVEPENVAVCRQISGFSSSGCLDIKGMVVGPSDQPLHGIDVVPLYPPGLVAFANSRATTDATGAFSLRLFRMFSQSPMATAGTLSVWVRGVDTRAVELGIAPRMLDSVLVRSSFSPLGTTPSPNVITLTIQAP